MAGEPLFKSRWGLYIGVGTLMAMVLGAILAGAVQALVPRIVAGALLGGGVAGGVLVLLGIVDRRTRLLHDRVRAGTIETRAMTNIRPLTDQVPLNVDDWAIPAETCERLVHEIMTRRPRTIVECGSGTSTVLMAACLRSFGIDGHIYSLDHESTFAERTRRQLKLAGLTDYATVITAPLTPHTVDGRSIRWYDFNPSDYLDQPIELLFVDGPPWDTDHLARLPAVPVLKEHLAEDCFILLDDGDRPEEREVAAAWSQELNFGSSLDGNWQPYWVLDRRT